MSSKQRTSAAVGALVGLALGLLFYTGGRSTTSALALAVGQALVGAVVGYLLARGGRRAR